MKFSIDKHEKYAVLTLEEETLDTRFAPNLKSELVLLNSTGFRNIILDTHKVPTVPLWFLVPQTM